MNGFVEDYIPRPSLKPWVRCYTSGLENYEYSSLMCAPSMRYLTSLETHCEVRLMTYSEVSKQLVTCRNIFLSQLDTDSPRFLCCVVHSRTSVVAHKCTIPVYSEETSVSMSN